MYGIIREENGNFYITRILGFYSNKDHRKDLSGAGRYFIVLNKERNALKRTFMYDPNSLPHLKRSVYLYDENTDDWVVDEYGFGCVDFLKEVDIDAMIDNYSFPKEIIEKCIEYDIPSSYKDINEITTEEDVEHLMNLCVGFHDAMIQEVEERDDGTLRVLLTIWSGEVELYFDCDVSYCTKRRAPENDDPWWFESSITFKDGFIYFYDDEPTDVDKLDETWCYFIARKMSYKFIPAP